MAIPESSEWTAPSDAGSVRLPFSSTQFVLFDAYDLQHTYHYIE